jgi:hypothetical protein
MKIDKNLNIVVPVEHDSGTVYVHAMPIGREVFETFHLVIAKTFAAIYAEGLGSLAAPKIAGMMLKTIATNLGQWEEVQAGLVAEIRRLSNVAVLGPNGWVTVPLQDAVDKKFFDAEDAQDVDGILTFFIVASAMHRRAVRRAELDGVASLWGAQISSLNCTEFAASLPTSTATDSTGEKAPASSIPS